MKLYNAIGGNKKKVKVLLFLYKDQTHFEYISANGNWTTLYYLEKHILTGKITNVNFINEVVY